MRRMDADVAVIGGGPGGYVCAIRAGQLGLRTIIIEPDKLGGECLNYGCIPSKSLITVSKLVDRLKEAEKFGLKTDGVSLDYVQMQKWKSEVVSKLVSGVEALLKGNHVTIIKGSAEILTKDRIAVTTQSGREEIPTRSIVIATGTEPIQLQGLERDGQVVIGSKEALELTSAPKRLLVVGGGAIGLEFACMYQKFGSQVTVVELMAQLLPGSDPEVVRVVQKKLEARGAKVFLGSKVTSLTKSSGVAKVELETPVGPISIIADKVLVSVGRRPRTAGMNIAGLGIKTDQRGFILASQRMMTNVDGVYAIGDVSGPPLLAHKASKQGIVAAECIAGLPSAADWRAMPDAIFTDPEVASVGITEAKAAEAGVEVKRTRFQFSALGRALSTGETEGFVKVVSRAKDGLVVGVQIVGPDASNLISEVALAMEMGATVEDIALTVHPHPTLSEALMEAAESASGSPIHQMKI